VCSYLRWAKRGAGREKHENNGTELLSHRAVDEARVGEERDNPVFQRVAKGLSA
jgi:hypothetical protein